MCGISNKKCVYFSYPKLNSLKDTLYVLPLRALTENFNWFVGLFIIILSLFIIFCSVSVDVLYFHHQITCWLFLSNKNPETIMLEC